MRITILSIVVLCCTGTVSATTWYPKDEECPLCEKESTYMVIGSYGSYIYSWPEKFQNIYWPTTDGNFLYTCLFCGYSCYMWDFDSIPDKMTDTLEKYLATVRFNPVYKKYYDVPMSIRLNVAEHVYRILGRDDEFWCRFYRIQGYHLFNENDSIGAAVARNKALELAVRMIDDEKYRLREKLFHFIAGAMYYFLDNRDKAHEQFVIAGKQDYFEEGMDKEDAEGFNSYLNGMITDYINAIAEGKDIMKY